LVSFWNLNDWPRAGLGIALLTLGALAWVLLRFEIVEPLGVIIGLVWSVATVGFGFWRKHNRNVR
jgi:hypothetical protein